MQNHVLAKACCVNEFGLSLWSTKTIPGSRGTNTWIEILKTLRLTWEMSPQVKIFHVKIKMNLKETPSTDADREDLYQKNENTNAPEADENMESELLHMEYKR